MNNGLLRIEYCLRGAFPEQPVRRFDNRDAGSYVFGNRRGDACCIHRYRLWCILHPQRGCPFDFLSCYAAELYLQQINCLLRTPGGCIDDSTVNSRNDRPLLRLRVPRTLGYMVDPVCPKALPAGAELS